MEAEYLIDCNRNSLKNLFKNHISERESEIASYKQFFKFCCTVKLYPELISSNEIKRILANTLKKTILEDKPIELSYLHFEKALKSIAEHCFPNGNSLKLLISYIKGACQTVYSIYLTTVAPLHSTYENASPRHHVSKLSLGKIKNMSVTHRKILNTSASQKNSVNKIDTFISPREQTLLSSKFLDTHSPRLKIINFKNKIKDQRKLLKVNTILRRFEKTHNKISENKKYTELAMKFVEKFVDSKMRIVRIT